MQIGSRPEGTRRRVLDPTERISEVLFGLIMVLTFTGSLSIADAGRDDVRAMLIGALGCNLAWGLIDAVLYLMGCLSDRGAERRLLRALRNSDDPAQARRALEESLPAAVVAAFDAETLEAVARRLRSLPEPTGAVGATAEDLRGAVGVFLLVFLSTIPVALPFVFLSELEVAMRLSNAIAIAMLFGLGAGYARLVGRSPWRFGAGMVLLGGVLVSLTMALGG